jgi:hypothetical protein
VSGTVMREPTYESYRLSLGRGDRFITDQGEGVETVNPDAIISPGARRSIIFHSCKLRGDTEFEIDGRKVYETSIEASVSERSPDHPSWPNEPWKIGALASDYRFLNLHVSPIAFQQLWETADAPENEQIAVGIRGRIGPHGVLEVYEIRLERIRPRAHPVVIEVKRLRQMIPRWVPALCAFVGAIFVIELIRWIWR